jgi:proline iminopeptidase
MQSRMQERKQEAWFEEAWAAFNDPRPAETDDEFGQQLQRFLPFYFYDPTNLEKYQDAFAVWTFSVDAWKGSEASQWHPVNLVPQLNEIKVPMLVVVGSHDFICSPLQAQQLHLAVAGSKMILIEKAGHFPWLEQPEQFLTLVRKGLTLLGMIGE